MAPVKGSVVHSNVFPRYSGGSTVAEIAPLAGTSAACSAATASRLSVGVRARRPASVGWATRSRGRSAASGLTPAGDQKAASAKLWNSGELKLVLSASMLAVVAAGSAGFMGPTPLSPPQAAMRVTAPAAAIRRDRRCAMGVLQGGDRKGGRVAQ